jgi:RimJ/RimL family protein N-acetyltransferase
VNRMYDPSLSVETDRLMLRLPTPADFDESSAMWGDAEIVRHIHERPFTREESWGRLMRYVGHWQIFGFGFWIVRERQGGAYVGEVGFGEMRRDVQPSFEGSPEIGWALASSAQGRGYATEAALAIQEWTDARHGARRTVCMIASQNAASIRVAVKCGYTEFARSNYRDSPVTLFERHTRNDRCGE